MTTPKVINLILYSSGDECYEMMAEALTRYLRAKNIEHYFYSYHPGLEEEYIIRDNHLLLRGEETFVPGILEKTLRAMEIFQDRDYDFIVRTNVSTIVDFDTALRDIPLDCDFAAFMVDGWGNGRWAPIYGITHETHAKYHTHNWPVGTFIVFSKKAVKALVADREILHSYGTVDDRAIGSYFHERPEFLSRKRLDWSKYAYNVTKSDPNVYAYRNKTDNRAMDVCRMNAIVKELLTSSLK